LIWWCVNPAILPHLHDGANHNAAFTFLQA
jgi:hypothetical protein